MSLPAPGQQDAGAPKIGQSWRPLQIARAAGAGGSVLDRAVGQGLVLSLALEDSPRRLCGTA